MQTIQSDIHGAADFELGRARTAPLRYILDLPDGPAKGLAFLIPGFGADADGEYQTALRRHVVNTHGLAAVSVRYHAIGARLETGAELDIPVEERLKLLGLATANGVDVPNIGDVADTAARLAARGIPAAIAGKLRPARGEYQNFGVMQALDHLLVLADIVRRGVEFDHGRVLALGSSHGGYIAHLMARFAPNSLAMVIDNSSYTSPPMQYLGQRGSTECVLPLAEGVMVTCGVESAWTLDDRAAANFYSRDRDLIRDVAYIPHLQAARAAATDGGTRIRMVNAMEDLISPPLKKAVQVDALRAAGFDARLFVVGHEEIDGRLFKTMTHGLDASLAGLFDLAMGEDARREGPLDCQAGTELVFPCIDANYRLRHTPAGIEAEVIEAGGETGGQAEAA